MRRAGLVWCEVTEFTNFEDFGKWTMNYRDMIMLSRYEESGLPRIDSILRAGGTSWPGNLDVLLYRSSEIMAVLEFQNTARVTVAEHCNNTPWQSTSKSIGLHYKIKKLIDFSSLIQELNSL